MEKIKKENKKIKKIKKRGWDQIRWISREKEKRKQRNKKKRERENEYREKRKKRVSLISKIYGNRAVGFRQSEKKS